MKKKKYKHVVWDWNGTILDDTWLCVRGINESLKKRGLATTNLTEYREIFTFPVEQYYKKLGFDFDKESFEKTGDEFVAYYGKFFHEVELHQGVKSVIKEIKDAGFSQSILSAGKQEYLHAWVESHDLTNYFTIIRGIDNQYARGKKELGIAFINELPFNQDDVIMIGDTTHDSDVAEAMNIDCILLNYGHMSANRLNNTGRIVLSNVSEILKYII